MNATVANYSWKLDQIDETVFGDGRLGCNYTVSGLNSNDNTPEFYILPGEYKISANVTNNNWNKYNESNATWIYNELIAIGLTDNLNLDNEVSSVILGNNSIIIGAWSSGNHNYVMTNWGNVPLETAWNASDPEHENYPDPCGGIGNKWILQGDDMQLDDDSRHEDENNGEVSPIFLFGGDSNDNNPERVYGYDTGMTICSSYECNDVHNKLNAYFHIKPPSSLTCVGAYSNLIVYDVYAFQ